MSTIAIIPARKGSKGIPHKNIVNLCGHPLIAYSIIAALESKLIDRVIVSTDCEDIANISRVYGAEVPFIRPKEIATDYSSDKDFFLHAINWINEYEGTVPDLWVHLRPTTPIRDPLLIDEAIKLFKKNKNATSLRSAHLSNKTPYKWFERDIDGYFHGIRPFDDRPEYYNLPRQSFNEVYEPNGYIDIILKEQVLKSTLLHGKAILAYITKTIHDIDGAEDLDSLRKLVDLNEPEILRLIRAKFKNFY